MLSSRWSLFTLGNVNNKPNVCSLPTAKKLGGSLAVRDDREPWEFASNHSSDSEKRIFKLPLKMSKTSAFRGGLKVSLTYLDYRI